MIDIPYEVKHLLNKEALKNVRISFPDQSHSDITNKDIEKESFEFEERTCSSEELKFGLCEGSKVAFIGREIGDIKNKSIFVEIEVFCDSTVEGATYKPDLGQYVYSIPIGFFEVSTCALKTIKDEHFYKVQAYSRLQNKYLDSDISEFWHSMFEEGMVAKELQEIFNILLPQYQLDRREQLIPETPLVRVSKTISTVWLDSQVTIDIEYASVVYDVSNYSVVSIYDWLSYIYELRNLYNDMWEKCESNIREHIKILK